MTCRIPARKGSQFCILSIVLFLLSTLVLPVGTQIHCILLFSTGRLLHQHGYNSNLQRAMISGKKEWTVQYPGGHEEIAFFSFLRDVMGLVFMVRLYVCSF